MNEKLGRLSQSVLPIALAAAFALSAFVFMFLPVPTQKDTPWHGYFTVVVGEQVPDRLIVDALSRVGLTHVVSSATAMVSFTDFSGTKEIPVSQIRARFDPIDPRLDPFLKRIGELFHTQVKGANMRVVYVPIHGATAFPGLGVLRVNALVHKALDPLNVTWYLLEWNGFQRLLFLISFLLFTALLVFRTRRHRLLVVLGALPWVGAPLVGSYGGLAAACVLIFAWAYFLEEAVPAIERKLGRSEIHEERRVLNRHLVVRVAFYVAATTVAFLLVFDPSAGTSSLLRVFSGLAGTTALAYLAFIAARHKENSREHGAFLPVRILQPSLARSIRGSYTTAVPLLLFLIILPPVILLLLPASASVSVPRPVAVSGVHGLSWTDLKRVWSERESGALPDLSDFLAHRAYQAAYLYHRPYSFPSPGQTISIPRYTYEGSRVIEHPEVMLTYSKSWFNSQIDGEGVLLSLLKSPGKAVRVMREPAARLYADYTVLLRHSLIVLLVFVPFLISLIRLSVRMRSGLRDTIVRKRRLIA